MAYKENMTSHSTNYYAHHNVQQWNAKPPVKQEDNGNTQYVFKPPLPPPNFKLPPPPPPPPPPQSSAKTSKVTESHNSNHLNSYSSNSMSQNNVYSRNAAPRYPSGSTMDRSSLTANSTQQYPMDISQYANSFSHYSINPPSYCTPSYPPPALSYANSYMNPCHMPLYPRKRNPYNETDTNHYKKGAKKRKKPLSLNIPTRKDWSVNEAKKALEVEKEFNKRHKSTSLIIKFPDLELNRDIVSQFHSGIESVHFQQPSTPRYCFVTLKEDVNADDVIKSLSKVKFGEGYLSVEHKKDREDDVNIGPEDIDPLTLYVGNLAQEVTKDDIVKAYPKQRRIDIGFAKKMKYTRYAFVSFRTVQDAIEAFQNTHATEMYSKSLIVRFRRLHGTVGMPGEPKPQIVSKKKEDSDIVITRVSEPRSKSSRMNTNIKEEPESSQSETEDNTPECATESNKSGSSTYKFKEEQYSGDSSDSDMSEDVPLPDYIENSYSSQNSNDDIECGVNKTKIKREPDFDGYNSHTPRPVYSHQIKTEPDDDNFYPDSAQYSASSDRYKEKDHWDYDGGYSQNRPSRRQHIPMTEIKTENEPSHKKKDHAPVHVKEEKPDGAYYRNRN